MLAALTASLLLAAQVSGSDESLAQTVLRTIEEHHAQTADLVARFTQSYRSGLIGREITERGVLQIKRPGRMRWDYKDPETKLFVTDGRTFYFYVPADRQVVVSEQDARHSLAARLLSGKGGLADEFTATLEEPKEEGVLRLRLVPRQPQADVERALVDVEPRGRIRAILLEDVQGNRTRFRFEDVRENTGIADRVFRFEVPKGVEVIHG